MVSEENNKPKTTLTKEDVRELIKSPFEKKIEITKKIADYYQSGGFNEKEMLVAVQIFRQLMKDSEVEVRKTLSEAIKNATNAPEDVILNLAKDIEDVSLPVLEFSDVLTDIDLIEIVNSTRDSAKHLAITKRHDVSEDVSEALIETKSDVVVDSLLQNEGAVVSQEGYDKIVDNFANDEKVMEAVVKRDTLPPEVVERLTNAVSDAIYKNLRKKHSEAFEAIDSKIVKRSRDFATMKVIGLKTTDPEYYQFRKLMDTLKVSEELIPVSALCMGNLHIFEITVARLTKTPVLNVRLLVEDESNNGFKALYMRAGLPESLYDATEVLIEVLREIKDELKGFSTSIPKAVADHIIECLRMKVAERGEVENLDYIISLITHNAMRDSDRL